MWERPTTPFHWTNWVGGPTPFKEHSDGRGGWAHPPLDGRAAAVSHPEIVHLRARQPHDPPITLRRATADRPRRRQPAEPSWLRWRLRIRALGPGLPPTTSSRSGPPRHHAPRRAATPRVPTAGVRARARRRWPAPPPAHGGDPAGVAHDAAAAVGGLPRAPPPPPLVPPTPRAARRARRARRPSRPARPRGGGGGGTTMDPARGGGSVAGGGGGGSRAPRPTASAAMAVPGRSAGADGSDVAAAAAAAAVAAAAADATDGRGAGGGGGDGAAAAAVTAGGAGVGFGLHPTGGARTVGAAAPLGTSLMLSHVAASPPGGGGGGWGRGGE
ncbi:hypothetical protein BU14_0316s0011 [Porphyra umbilicalis]|uniref:Uncharacterized protein n=1 Tax=Porphyra umbilicalis TaxID=2786 RepID=A0A1X6P011_PORUM|nr:hypothetical protein BU14_0316s0011 [Porphyra umbilicalis]|eukprot:OSX73983.1 hypothetical protein BU14_0316s0011 [Porphyra umbilicalis]